MAFFAIYPDIEDDETTIRITRSQYTKDASRITAMSTVLMCLVFTAVYAPNLLARHDPSAFGLIAVGVVTALPYLSWTRDKVITLDLSLGQYEQVLVPALWNRRSHGRMADLSVKCSSNGGNTMVLLVDRSRRWFSVIATLGRRVEGRELAQRIGEMAHIPVEIIGDDV